ncbi:CopD family protein [Klebsiella pneumoniae]|uniref:CopD family protein n=1 Tax=Klebsiella pneumoniae TaxID=573 RepID=UPI0039174492
MVVLLAYFIWIGRLLKGVAKGRALPLSRALRWINEIPLLAFIPIVWLVLAKPF